MIVWNLITYYLVRELIIIKGTTSIYSLIDFQAKPINAGGKYPHSLLLVVNQS